MTPDFAIFCNMPARQRGSYAAMANELILKLDWNALLQRLRTQCQARVYGGEVGDRKVFILVYDFQHTRPDPLPPRVIRLDGDHVTILATFIEPGSSLGAQALPMARRLFQETSQTVEGGMLPESSDSKRSPK